MTFSTMIDVNDLEKRFERAISELDTTTKTMYIGIVGARDYPYLHLVHDYVQKLSEGCVVVSGGARGVDTAAESAALRFGLKVIVHRPERWPHQTRQEYTAACYDRNQLIVDDADLLIAFTHKSYGGTWDTIKKAKAKHIQVIIVVSPNYITEPL